MFSINSSADIKNLTRDFFLELTRTEFDVLGKKSIITFSVNEAGVTEGLQAVFDSAKLPSHLGKKSFKKRFSIYVKLK